MRTVLRRRPLAAALVFCLSSPLLLGSALAQSSSESDQDNAAELDTIVVTGSNLKGIDLQDAQPVKVFDIEDIKASGAVTVADLLAEVSQAGGGTGNFSTANSGAKQGDSPAGFAGVSLRGLGTASTLTLVNGRRVAVASFANGSENFVDINAIPLAAVDRVEVLTTGASAVYGADAVAGVVNFVLRKDFEGLRLSGSYADSAASSDEGRYNANLVWGRSGEQSRAMLIVDAYKRNALYDRDRPISAVEPRPSQQGIYPSFNDLFAQDIDFVEASCPDGQRYDGRPGFPASRFGEYCELNRNAFTASNPEEERLGLYATFGYHFNEQLEWFGELAVQRNESRANSEPAPWSQEEIDFHHPGMPTALRQRLLDAGVDPDFSIFGWGRFPDPRTIEVETRNWRLVSGLSGVVGDWTWDSALNVARSDSEQRAIAGIYNVERFRAALLGQLCADGSINCSPDNGGVYYNPFNGQTENSAEVLGLLRERVPRAGESKLYGWDMKFAGDLGEAPAGPIAWAFGAELRREEVRDDPSPLATADPISGEVPVYGFGSTAVAASRNQWAVFAETLIPLHDSFDLRLAGRYDHYDDFGGDFNPAASFRWQAHESIVVRGGWNSSFRAPSLAQSGAGTTLSSGALPCADGSEFFDSFCDGFAEDDFYLSEIYGNPDLKAETSEAWNLGAVFQLGDSTTLTFDWFNFEHENLVDIDANELFRRALLDPSLVVARGELGPGQIGIETRNGTIGSPIEEIHLNLINVGVQKTDGLDISLEHRLEPAELGAFTLFFDATWTHSFQRSESCGDDVSGGRRGVGLCRNGVRLVERVDEFRYPEWLAVAGIKWRYQDYTTRLWADYTDSYYDDDQRDGVPAGRRISSWTVLHASLTWDIGENAFTSLTVRNLADRDPPRALGSATNFDEFNHDSLGRWFQLSYTHRF
ncbi:TonB-dependent receptor plug domain-containing protein [Pseudomarimonas arenosa]|uniref:TonB-dependent receptor n=1 Tax=Pseudomarimonas arenosa TaxID=2774145 RepID=A0AAW3ZIH2_9GAMM|nr:TonB-dependent receptor [Pseudomarimonas arenosa]MBD8525796.1 TonB-dependent receptor [Pseudomarimonas arenosa]